jgi:hypothetical protein
MLKKQESNLRDKVLILYILGDISNIESKKKIHWKIETTNKNHVSEINTIVAKLI